jgi:hypothetical protein
VALIPFDCERGDFLGGESARHILDGTLILGERELRAGIHGWGPKKECSFLKKRTKRLLSLRCFQTSLI